LRGDRRPAVYQVDDRGAVLHVRLWLAKWQEAIGDRIPGKNRLPNEEKFYCLRLALWAKGEWGEAPGRGETTSELV